MSKYKIIAKKVLNHEFLVNDCRYFLHFMRLQNALYRYYEMLFSAMLLKIASETIVRIMIFRFENIT
jgi:hypothetical protein